jgi:DNA-directed RNA polymerase specialized sigma24 family protein
MAPVNAQDEDLARRVYAYFIFRLRQPGDAERLTRLSFERVWEEAKLSREVEQEPDMPVFAAARAVIADNPRPRGASKVAAARAWGQGEGRTGLSNELAMAIGRLHGRERDALALRFGAELSVGEIAALIDRTPGEVKQRLARGVRALRELGVLPKQSQQRKSAAKRPRSRGAKGGQAKKRESGD